MARSTPSPIFATVRELTKQFKTYSDMERASGLPEGTISRILKQGNEPRANHLVAIHDATGCDLRWLLTGEGEPYPKGRDGGQTRAQAICVRSCAETIAGAVRLLVRLYEDETLAARSVVHVRWLERMLEEMLREMDAGDALQDEAEPSARSRSSAAAGEADEQND